MNSFEESWNRLVALVRRAWEGEETPVAPQGFSTRVVAQWLATRPEALANSVWEWLAMRGLGVSVVIAVLAIIVVWPIVNQSTTSEELVALADPLSLEEVQP